MGPGREAITKIVKSKVNALNAAGKAEAVVKQWNKLGNPMPAFYKKSACCCA
jgi:hypothetical protein